MAATVKVVGVEKLLKKLDADKLAGPEKSRIIQATARFAQGQLETRVPRRSGTLANSMRLQSSPDSARLSLGAFYGRFQEFGTRYVRRRRFMARTIGAARKELRRLVEEAKSNIERKWAA